MKKTPPEIFITRGLLDVLSREYVNSSDLGDDARPSYFMKDFYDWVDDCVEHDVRYFLPNGLYGRHKANLKGSHLHHVHMEPIIGDVEKWHRDYERWLSAYNDAIKPWRNIHPNRIFDQTPTSDVCLLFSVRDNNQYLLIDFYTDVPPGAHELLWNHQPNALVKAHEEEASKFVNYSLRTIYSLEEVIRIESKLPVFSQTGA